MADDRSLELTVLHQGCAFGDFASAWMPRLLVTVRGTTERLDLKVPDRKDEVRFGACGVNIHAAPGEAVSEREVATAWRYVGHEEIAALIDLLAQVGLPGQPEVKAVVDTGDYFQATVLTGAIDDVPFYLRVSYMQTGYRGRDAEAFANLMRRVLALANIDPDDPRWCYLTMVESSP